MPDISSFDNSPILGFQSTSGDQPLQNALSAVYTLDGGPNALPVGEAFRDPRTTDGDILRTLLFSVLSSPWYKKKDLEQMPKKTLDTFVQGQGDEGTCQFCHTQYNHVDKALDCVKQHVDL